MKENIAIMLTKSTAKRLIQATKAHIDDNDEQLVDFVKRLTKTELFYLVLT